MGAWNAWICLTNSNHLKDQQHHCRRGSEIEIHWTPAPLEYQKATGNIVLRVAYCCGLRLRQSEPVIHTNYQKTGAGSELFSPPARWGEKCSFEHVPPGIWLKARLVTRTPMVTTNNVSQMRRAVQRNIPANLADQKSSNCTYGTSAAPAHHEKQDFVGQCVLPAPGPVWTSRKRRSQG